MTKSSASRGATHVAVDSATRGISDLFDASIDSDFVDVVAITGALIGIAGAVASLGVLDKLLFGLSPFDVVNLALAALILILDSLAATLAPARRAAAVDPLVALRCE